MLARVTDAVAAHGEAPIWHPDGGGLIWVDMTSGDVLRLDEQGTVQRWHVAPLVTAVRPRFGGGYVLAVERGIVLADHWGGSLTDFATLTDPPDVRCNDIGCDPSGGLWFGTMANDYSAGGGSLYALSPSGAITRVLRGLGVANGIDWTPDGGTAYHADTLSGEIRAFGWSVERGLGAGRRFVRIPVEAGRPDGLTVDILGGVWVALWDGGAVHRYLPDGSLDVVLDMPARLVTACAFGGPDLDRLYITTIRGKEPDSGAVFCADVGVRGQPVRSFAG